MSESLIQMHSASRFYKTVIGVGDINLDLPPGAYGLIGPNGSGKTTLLNLITGMLAPSLGRVAVFGVDPQRDRTVLRRIGLCPASDILYPNITGLQWAAYQTALHGFSTTEANRRAKNSLIRLGMQENMHRPIGSYSLGMRQRVKLAQAIAHEPDLLILDEPFNGLDPIGRHELTEFLQDWGKQGRSLLLASHILHEVESVTTSFLLIHGGRILATGDAREVSTMLSGFPVDVRLVGTGLEVLAREFVGADWLNGMSFERDDSAMTLKVSDNNQFLSALAEAALLPGVNIEAVDTPDGTLEAAFDLLLRVHRGEHSQAQAN